MTPPPAAQDDDDAPGRAPGLLPVPVILVIHYPLTGPEGMDMTRLERDVDRARQRMGWTQADLCAAVPIHRTTLYRLLVEHKGSAATLGRILLLLGLDPHQYLRDPPADPELAELAKRTRLSLMLLGGLTQLAQGRPVSEVWGGLASEGPFLQAP
jgi:hypothetical protein